MALRTTFSNLTDHVGEVRISGISARLTFTGPTTIFSGAMLNGVPLILFASAQSLAIAPALYRWGFVDFPVVRDRNGDAIPYDEILYVSSNRVGVILQQTFNDPDLSQGPNALTGSARGNKEVIFRGGTG